MARSKKRLWGFDDGEREILIAATAAIPGLRGVVERAGQRADLQGLWVVEASVDELDEMYSLVEALRSQLRALLKEGTAYASRHPEDWRVAQQLRHLAITLLSEAKVAKQVVGEPRTSSDRSGEIIDDCTEPGPRVAVIIDRPVPGVRTRCRMRRPWRRPARRPDPHGDPQ